MGVMFTWLTESHFALFGLAVLYKWFLHGSFSIQLKKWTSIYLVCQAVTVQIPGFRSTAKMNELTHPFETDLMN